MTESKAVFLSYASQDAAAAQRICEALSAAGIEVWLDTAELRGGDVWDQKIRRQIKDCALFMPIISANTQTRVEGYFRLEWRLADQRTHMMGRNRSFLVPVCIDNTCDTNADVPESFSAVQWTRLPSGQASAVFVERMSLLLSLNSAAAAPSTAAIMDLVSTSDHQLQPASKLEADIRHRGRPAWPKALLGLITAVIGVLPIVYWLLHRNASQARPQSVQIAAASGPIPPVSTVAPEKSVAVLAFTDMSEKKDQEYFSDGLTEEMIALLSQLSDLRVPARTSSFYFKGKNDTIADIAKQLSVANVLEGSVRKAGKRLRITVQLIRADNGYHVWSQTYDRQDADIFAIQDDIAKAVVAALRGRLEGGVSTLDVMHGTKNAQAFNEYLRGRELHRRSDSLEGRRQAVESFKRAIAFDPGFGLAYAELAVVEEAVCEYACETGGIENARRHAERAIELAPNEERGYSARGLVRMVLLWDWAGAQADIEKSVSMNPRDSHVQNIHAWLLHTMGRLPEAIEAEKQVAMLDPWWMAGWCNLATYYTESGDYASAQAALDRAVGLDSDPAAQLAITGDLRLLQHRSEEALDTFRKIEQVLIYKFTGIAMAEYALGHATEAQQASKDMIANYANDAAYDIAEVFAWRGENDKAFEWLDRAYRQRDVLLTDIKLDPFIQTVRSDPRYKALLTKMKLPE